MPGIIKRPSLEDKLDILAQSARYDVCMASCNANSKGGRGRTHDPRDPLHRWIYPAHLPGGGLISILKVLQTNICQNRCSYCAISADRDTIQRVTFCPQGLADAFMELVYRRLAEGIFISSGTGVRGNSAMERMIHTAEILRKRYNFKGYIHLKLLPGVSFDLIENAAKYADRISMNLEAPTRGHLKQIAPDKRLVQDLIQRMKWTASIIQKGSFAKSQITQFVVGASDETDIEIMRAVDWVYRELYVFRAFFSAFQPVDDSEAPEQLRTSLLREHRLYQSDFLLRGYGFRLKDMVFDRHGKLPEDVDPKTAYALMHPELYPVDINRADEALLLKVPGIGPVSARRIVQNRLKNLFHTPEELKCVGVVVKRALPYIEFSGKRASYRCLKQEYVQKMLFDSLHPEEWSTGLVPYQEDKIAVPSTGERSRANSYEYPAQKGKPLLFSKRKKRERIVCR